MATLDTMPQNHGHRLYGKRGEDLTLADNDILNELIEMFSDFDRRFVQYPLCTPVTSCQYAYIDHGGIARCLDVLIKADRLARRGR